MTRIRVNPAILNQSAGGVSTTANQIHKIGEDVWHSANGAPSYDGQFGPKLRSIGQNAMAQAQRHSSRMSGLSGSLSKRASAFLAADVAFVKGFRESVAPLIFLPPSYLKYSALNRSFLAQINRLLRIGQLRVPRPLWNPSPVYAYDIGTLDISREAPPNLRNGNIIGRASTSSPAGHSNVIDDVTSRMWDGAKAIINTAGFLTKKTVFKRVNEAVGAVDFFLKKMPEAEVAFRAWEDYNRKTDGWDPIVARRLQENAKKHLDEMGLSFLQDALGTITDTLGDNKLIREAIVRLKDAVSVMTDWLSALGPKN